MANFDHLAILKKGVQAWNQWREENEQTRPDLSGANLLLAPLNQANLEQTNLQQANLTGASLSEAHLNGADLSGAELSRANLSRAYLHRTNLSLANLRGANLRGASLWFSVNLSYADLTDADFTEAKMGRAIFGDTDLSVAKGLETIEHGNPSTIGIDTIFRSRGKIPHAFLRGAGVPEILIDYLPSLLGAGVEFYSLFISYSTADEAFATRLHNDLQVKGVRCWFAPHDMESGRKIHEQVEQAIHMQERVLVILSESSIQKPWVQYELKNARKRELEEQRPVLFPISICNYQHLKDWKLFHLNADLAEEIREYYIPDFSEWNDSTKYNSQLERLVKSLNKKSDPS